VSKCTTFICMHLYFQFILGRPVCTTHSCVSLDSFVCVAYDVYSVMCIRFFSHIVYMNKSCDTRTSRHRQDSYVTWLICDMAHMWHDSYVTWMSCLIWMSSLIRKSFLILVSHETQQQSYVTYRVAKTQRMPYLYSSFFAKEPHNQCLFCVKWPAT